MGRHAVGFMIASGRNCRRRNRKRVTGIKPQLCVSTKLLAAWNLKCGSQNKQPLYPYTALTDWFLKLRWGVFTARYGLDIYHFQTTHTV